MNGGCTHLDRIHDVTPSSWDCEDWYWCYFDQLVFELQGAPPAPSHP